MEPWASVLPNLSIGVIAVLSLVFVIKLFIDTLKDIRREHEQSMKERELAFRALEREVRTEIFGQLAKNTAALERVINFIEKN